MGDIVDNSDIREWVALPQHLLNGQSLLPVGRKKAKSLLLVLDSQGIASRINRYGLGWQIMVPQDHELSAIYHITKYETENRGWPPPPPAPNPLIENTLSSISVLLLLATFYNLTNLNIPLFGHPSPDWLSSGKASASLILYGEWWRTITSLTLHANALHLLGNIAIGGIFIVFLCRELGSGLAWFILMISGILGNYANAYFQLPTHNSVGSSTLIFGGVGILAALSMIRYRNHRRKRWFAPLGGALALLASLGTEGANTDLGAHFFGFVCGFIAGVITEYLTEKYGLPGKRTNSILALICAAVVALAWWKALSSV